MSTRSQIDIESQKDPATLEREIDQQRAAISHIVEALESRLSPGEIIDRVLGYAKGNGGDFFNNLTTTVKENPVPTLLTGIGMAWLMLGQQHQANGSSAYANKTDKADKQNSLHNKSNELKSKLSQMGHELGESGHHAADHLRHGAERTREGFDKMLREQPMAIGATGIAIGALLAAAFPPTRQEEKLMDKARDQLNNLQQEAQEARKHDDRDATQNRPYSNELKKGTDGSQYTSLPH
ncbi:DUF3618 domain-containing protein [Azomonas macrocytogenes]|uniref:DUF3618 domain-containing protein n=1 Tax=Azomonas macrocytogenes TaxID=69962 RepID=UPI001605FDA3|nr:DUF3618 domain-containing protein [Azomonas macrocytogenes]